MLVQVDSVLHKGPLWDIVLSPCDARRDVTGRECRPSASLRTTGLGRAWREQGPPLIFGRHYDDVNGTAERSVRMKHITPAVTACLVAVVGERAVGAD